MDYAIIAAGEGSRLVQEGISVPKPLIKLNGEEMIGRLIGIFLRNGATSVNIVVNEEMNQVQEYLSDLKIPVPLNVVVKSTPSSMHSFYELRHLLKNGKFCLTTVDTVFKEEDFSEYIQAFSESEDVDGMMAVTSFVDDEKPLYVDTDQNMNIRGFFDTSNNYKYISGGIYGLTPKAIPLLENCIGSGQSRMRNFQRQLIFKGLRLRAYAFPKIVDVDHVGDIEIAEAFLRE